MARIWFFSIFFAVFAAWRELTTNLNLELNGSPLAWETVVLKVADEASTAMPPA